MLLVQVPGPERDERDPAGEAGSVAEGDPPRGEARGEGRVSGRAAQARPRLEDGLARPDQSPDALAWHAAHLGSRAPASKAASGVPGRGSMFPADETSSVSALVAPERISSGVA